MADGPWTQYAPPSDAPAEGPWTQFAPQARPTYMGGSQDPDYEEPKSAPGMGGALAEPGGTATDINAPIETQLRTALAPAPGTTYGSLLPIARDDKSGAYRLALPSSMRDAGTGLLDLMEGPTTGTVTPEASQLLFGAMTSGGLAPSIARGTGEAIGGRAFGAGRNETPDLLGDTFRAAPQRAAEGDAAVVPEGLRVVDDQPAPVAAPVAEPVNPLAEAAAPPAPEAAPVNGLSAAPEAATVADAPRLNPLATDAPAAPVEPGPLASALIDNGVPVADGAVSPTGIAPPARPLSFPSTDVPVPTGPSAAGAMSSTASEAALTPAQVAAYRTTAEGQKLLEPQPHGVEDRNIYIQGVNPTTAQIEQSVNTSRELKALGIRSPEVSAEAKEIASEHNLARKTHVEQTVGSDVDRLNAKAERGAQATEDLAEAWKNKQAADAQPIVDLAAEIKKSSDGRRPAVRSVLDSVTKELVDESGNLHKDPEQLYGVRKHIDDLLDELDPAGKPKHARAEARLLEIKAALDDVIEKAAPGFKQYLDNFSKASRRIDEMEILQKHEAKLYDANNRITYNKVQTMMRQIIDSQRAPGLNKYKSITPETMQRLWALRDDLRRVASEQELARTPGGSDTAQNVWDVAKIGGSLLAHGAANMVAPGLGSVGLNLAEKAVAPGLARRAERRDTRRGLQLLHPDPARYPPRNPLAD